MNATSSLELAVTASEIVAAPLEREIDLNAAHPSPLWQPAEPIIFCKDWRGENEDPGLRTQVKSLWSKETIYFRFDCRFRELFVFEEAEPNGRRDRLWERDVAEVFLQADPSRPNHYQEFEISPNGMWIDLDVSHREGTDLESRLRRSAFLDKAGHTWAAELAIPMNAITARFDPAASWRVNFFRIEGAREPRTYHAWRPTMTPQPNFHVVDAFGEMRFGDARR